MLRASAAPLLPLLLLALPAASLRRSELQRAERGLRPLRYQSPPPEPKHARCKVSPTQACPVESLATNQITMVYPDPNVSKTRCLLSQHKEFAFQVVPRNPRKLLLYFEGGGACWSKGTTVRFEACWRDRVWAYPTEGNIFDARHSDNPFRDYTVVWVNACSGDLHGGNATRDYVDDDGEYIEQHGYYNTKAVVDWVKANLAKEPISDLLLMGESAGAIGVQIWARKLLTELPYERVALVADSYVAVFPPTFQGNVFKVLGVCETGVLASESLQESCEQGNLTIPDVMDATIRDFPNVTFATLTSKYDDTQQVFYRIAASSIGQRTISPQDFHSQAEGILRRYNRYPNFVTYLVTSDHHVFTNGYIPFRAIAPSDLDNVFNFRVMREPHRALNKESYVRNANGIVIWLSQFPPSTGRVVRSYCDLKDSEHMLALTATSKYPETVDSCPEDLANKTFVVP
mmetsp:Transcript_13268/g.41916  ORF Transcript_13268/g.41916 Transcript_13268/m.41916 type:complete len:459 (-) Transcript_13268:38-1414(-)